MDHLLCSCLPAMLVLSLWARAARRAAASRSPLAMFLALILSVEIFAFAKLAIFTFSLDLAVVFFEALGRTFSGFFMKGSMAFRQL